MRARPAAALSIAAVLLAGAAYAPLAAAPAPPTGAASSTLGLVDLAVGATRARVLELSLRSDTVDGAPSTAAVLTPLTVGADAYGRRELRTRSAVLPTVDTSTLAPAAVTGLVSARSPEVSVAVEGGTSRASAGSLGGLTVLGLPLVLDGRLELSADAGAGGTAGGKELSVRGLALPSLADLLAVQGLDLEALPADLLGQLLTRLDLHTTVTRDAEAALRAALNEAGAAASAATARAAAAGAAVAAADEQQAAARARLADATRTLEDARAALGARGGLRGLDRFSPGLPPVAVPALPALPVPSDGSTPAAAEAVLDAALDPVLEPVVTVVTPGTDPVVDAVLPQLPPVLPGAAPLPAAVTAAQEAYDAARSAAAAAEAAAAAARRALADAQAALAAALAPHTAQLQALVTAATDVLRGTPLVSLDRLEVSTRSAVTSAQAGGQSARVVGGQVEGLRVLGTDVLAAALGDSRQDVLALTGRTAAAVDAEVTRLTGAVSDVLSGVPSLPGLQVPAPRVQLLAQTTTTDVVQGFGVAGSALRALTVSWSGIAVPAAVALPGAATLPAVAGLALPGTGALRTAAPGDLVSQPLSLSIGTLEDRARFRPAAAEQGTGDGTGGSPAGPDTGPVTGAAPDAALPDGVPAAERPAAGQPVGGRPAAGTPGTGTATPVAPPAPGDVAPPARPRTTPVGLQELPRTGPAAVPALLGLALVLGAAALRRRAV